MCSCSVCDWRSFVLSYSLISSDLEDGRETKHGGQDRRREARQRWQEPSQLLVPKVAHQLGRQLEHV